MRLRNHARWLVLPSVVHILLAAAPVNAFGPRLEGVVRDSLSGAGVADAAVAVAGTTIAATTDGSGRFVLTCDLETKVVLGSRGRATSR